MDELLRLSAKLHAEHGNQPRLARRRTDRALQLRSAEALENSSVHRSAVQRPQGSTVGIRQNRLAAKLADDAAKARCNFIERFVPGNALPNLRSAGALARVCGSRNPLRSYPPRRIQHSVRRIHPVQILRYLPAQKSPRHRMPRVPLNLRRPPVLDGDQYPASIGAIVRTRGMDNFFHNFNLRSVDYKGGQLLQHKGHPHISDALFPLRCKNEPYFSSNTSFSLPLLISSIFLISSSVSFWISSSDRFSSSSVIFLSFIAFLMASLPSRRIFRTAVRCSSSTLCRCFTMSWRRSWVRAGTGTRIILPSFIGFSPSSAERIAFSITPICDGSKGCTVIICGSCACTCAIWFSGICEP